MKTLEDIRLALTTIIMLLVVGTLSIGLIQATGYLSIWTGADYTLVRIPLGVATTVAYLASGLVGARVLYLLYRRDQEPEDINE